MADEEGKEIVLGEEDLDEAGKVVDRVDISDKMDEDHPRFRQVYGKMRQLERDMETLTKTLGERDKMVDEMRSHNKRLADSIEKGFKSVSAEKDTTADEITKIEGEITNLKEQKKAAIKDENFDLLDELNDKIYDKKDTIKALRAKKAESTPSPSGKGEDGLTDDERVIVSDFVKDTPWFNEDPIMRAAAIATDNILKADNVWGRKPLKERLIEVRSRIEKRFGIEQKRPGGADGGGGLDGGGGGGKIIRLSKDQQDMARNLGLSEKDYAKQLSIIEGGK